MGSTRNRRGNTARRPNLIGTASKKTAARERRAARGEYAAREKTKAKRKSDIEQKNVFSVVAEIIVLLAKKTFKKTVRCVKKLFSGEKRSLFGDYELAFVFIAIFAAVLVLFFVFWVFTNKNAYEVYLDNNSVGIIKLNKNVTDETLFQTVTGKISNDLEQKIKSGQKITIKNIHASVKKIETEDSLILKLAGMLKYTVEATVITLDGNPMAYIKNDAEYARLRERLIAPYRKVEGAIIDEGFVEDIATVTEYVDASVIIDEDAAFALLNSKYETQIKYVMKPGDTLSKIALEHRTTIDEICASSGISIDEATRLQVGTELKIGSKKPLVSVFVTTETTYLKTKEFETITRTAPTKSQGHTAVLQQGVNGEAEVKAHITYINGVLHSQEDVSEKIVTPPVNEIIEVGTG